MCPYEKSELPDWGRKLGQLRHAHGDPVFCGTIKTEPDDFHVTEIMDISPCGEGEHVWVNLTKRQCNTDQLAKALARFSNVAYRDVGYSGLKDFFAVTQQWFSIWLPKGDIDNWKDFQHDGVTVNQVSRHTRKIKRGTHRANHFDILIRGTEKDTEFEPLQARLNLIKREGVPNYFGPQRFGRQAANMHKAVDMLINNKRIKDRGLRSLLLSATRSWLFNQVLSARVENKSWVQLQPGEPACLNGSNSVFSSTGEQSEAQRIQCFDIHPSAPMWGQGYEKVMQACAGLHQWECDILKEYRTLCVGLEDARLNYQRRATRTEVIDLKYAIESNNNLRLTFELQRGQFATSVLREIVSEPV